MNKRFAMTLLTVLLAACAAAPRYQAAFADLDENRDAIIEWREFKGHYPEADPKAFMEADRNKDGDITPDEWRFYVETQAP